MGIEIDVNSQAFKDRLKIISLSNEEVESINIGGYEITNETEWTVRVIAVESSKGVFGKIELNKPLPKKIRSELGGCFRKWKFSIEPEHYGGVIEYLENMFQFTNEDYPFYKENLTNLQVQMHYKGITISLILFDVCIVGIDTTMEVRTTNTYITNVTYMEKLWD